MLARMKGRDYELPAALGLSEPCKSLLHAMLQPDPQARVKMAGIMADPWFLTHLPPNAINMNEGYLAKPRPCAQVQCVLGGVGCRRVVLAAC